MEQTVPGVSWCQSAAPVATNSTAARAAVSTMSLGHSGELWRLLEKFFDTASDDNIGVDLTSYLQNIAFAGDHLVKHRVDEEAQQKARNQSGNNDDGERLLRIGADTR